MTENQITIRLPGSHWYQIVDDIKEMCGGVEDIEILSSVEILDDGETGLCHAHLKETHFECTRKRHLTSQAHSCMGVDGTVILWHNKREQVQ